MGPRSIESEKAYLGELLTTQARQAMDIVQATGLDARDFWLERHRVIFKAIISLAARGHPPDVVLVLDHLRRQGDEATAGGPQYLAEISGAFISLANTASHGRVIRERAIQRQAIKASEDLAAGMTNGVDVMASLMAKSKQLETMAGELGDGVIKATTSASLADSLHKALKGVRERQEDKGGMLGPGVGIEALDWAMKGLTPNDLHVICGRPGMGKTALACQWALNTARQGGGVLYASLEMSKEELAMRMLGTAAELNVQRIATMPRETLLPSEQDRLDKWDVLVRTYKIDLESDPATTPQTLEQRAVEKQASPEGLDLVVVDYLQLMETPDFKGSERVAAVSFLSRSLKKMAQRLGVPVLCLCQLNRMCEARKDKRPMLSDLRESGQIEADASTVICVYRDDVYYKPKPNQTWSDVTDPMGHQVRPGQAELIINKFRGGKPRTIYTKWVGKYTRFYSTEAAQ